MIGQQAHGIMTLYSERYRIESRRLKGHHYAAPGEYFVTICTKSMVELFGQVMNAVMSRNEMGEIAHQMWVEIPKHHTNVKLDEFIVMPNHVHGIIVLRAGSDVACNVTDISTRNPSSFMSQISPKRGSLGTIIRSYKSAVTNWCHMHDHDDVLWQPRFHDHIIRNKKELNAIRAYIRNNPANWQKDNNHLTEVRF